MGCCGAIVKGLLWVITWIWDILTFPFYICCQSPCKNLKEFHKPKARIVSEEGGITYRGTNPFSAMHIELESKQIDTLDKVFQYAVKRNGSKKCLGSRKVINEEDEVQSNGKVFKKYVLGDYLWKTYTETDRLALCFSKGLRELGMEPMQRIAVLAETRAEWLISAMAAFRQNLTMVTLYATLGEDAIIHGLNETEVEFVLTSHDQLPKFKNVLMQTPKVKKVIYMEDPLNMTDTSGYREDVEILAFCDVIANGCKSNKEPVEPTPDDVAIIMYTSGSTGTPKGVLLSHRNVSVAMMAFSDALGPVYPDDIYIGYLPLAHVMELMCETICFLSGLPIGYSSPLTMVDTSSKIQRGCKGDTSVLRPTILVSVPLVLDRIYKSIQEKINSGGCCKKALVEFYYDYKLKWYYKGYTTPLTNRLIFKPIKQALGGRVRLLVAGGAPLAPDVHQFIRTTLCVPVLQGYGLTETSACASVTLTNDMSTGRVGAPMGCCDIRLVDWEEGNYTVTNQPYPRGEIVIGGHNVALGYYKLPEVTATDFFEDDGRRWFRSGDIGEMHDDGVLKIIDRKKDLVKLQFGEYVSLGKVEAEMKTCPIVDNICIYGDPTKTFCVALVVPNPKHLEAIADKVGRSELPLEMLCQDPEVVGAVLQLLQAHAAKCKLQKFEIPGAITLCSDSEYWTPEKGLVTAAFKLRRKNVQERYKADIERMYSSVVM